MPLLADPICRAHDSEEVIGDPLLPRHTAQLSRHLDLVLDERYQTPKPVQLTRKERWKSFWRNLFNPS